MSLSNIKTYFRARMDALSFNEWTDGFNIENIPNNILDKSYHIQIERVTGGPINHTHQPTTSDVILTFYTKGYRNPSQAIDETVVFIEDIVKEICNVANRTSLLLNVVFEQANILPLSESNDNQVLCEMLFTADVILGVEEI